MSFELVNQNNYHCDHTDRQLRKRVYSNHTIHYVMQCQKCGQVGNAISHEQALTLLQGKEPLPYDSELRERFLKSCGF